ncbi:leukotriene B4 receptor 1-like [Brienomyrus brachyistius]|uniref:leukotriene B4 receptor 1-like n=1 Tax=Brienomyrus brachyistius TaxID=42636 RepID=UPI0020B2C0AC|nr:leukotriene B4 receptor 1-like [Brienomyrus brachyistius]
MSNSSAVSEWNISGMAASGILGLAFLVGAPGNLLVIWTIVQHVKLRSFTVALILHLAVADLLVVITLPFWIYSMAQSWIFGPVACKAVVYVVCSCMYASVFLITAMSVERYVAIRYPFSLMNQKRTAILVKALAGIWALAFLFAIPSVITYHVDMMDGIPQCLFRTYSSLSQEVVCFLLEIVIGFIIPYLVLGICYRQVASYLRQMNLQQKCKSSTVIICIVVAFAICWFPYHLNNTIHLFNNPDVNEPDESFYHALSLISGALVFINSSLNPVLYTFVARRFQGSLMKSNLVKLFKDIASTYAKSPESTDLATIPNILHNEQTRM